MSSVSPSAQQPPALSPETLQRILAAGLEPERLPRHIAVIMDGNGRWAQERGLPRHEGHRQGVRSVRATIEECCRLGIGRLAVSAAVILLGATGDVLVVVGHGLVGDRADRVAEAQGPGEDDGQADDEDRDLGGCVHATR